MGVKLTSKEGRARLRELVTTLHDGGTGDIAATIAGLKELGAVNGIHVGKEGMGPDGTVEWYAGQILDVLESEAFFAVNSICNCLDKFAPELEP